MGMKTEYEQYLIDNFGNAVEDHFGLNYGGIYKYIGLDRKLEIVVPKLNRYEVVQKYAFAIPNVEALETIAKYSPIIEIGSGSGYWAYELRKLGVDIIATDPDPVGDNYYGFTKVWTEILPLTAVHAIEHHRDRVLMLSWPSYGQLWAYEALTAYEGEYLIYIGEWGDCCGDSNMVDHLNEIYDEITEISIPTWWGIHDRLWILKRKS